jgi:hypothetical protein
MRRRIRIKIRRRRSAHHELFWRVLAHVHAPIPPKVPTRVRAVPTRVLQIEQGALI